MKLSDRLSHARTHGKVNDANGYWIVRGTSSTEPPRRIASFFAARLPADLGLGLDRERPRGTPVRSASVRGGFSGT